MTAPADKKNHGDSNNSPASGLQEARVISQIDRIFHETEQANGTEIVELSIVGIAQICQLLADQTTLPLSTRISALKRIQDRITATLGELTPPQPLKAPALWANRGKNRRHMSPCDFIIENYQNYGLDLTMADIRQLDPKLYKALENWKGRNGLPEGFNLPTKKEHNKNTIKALTLQQKRELKRISEAARYRKSRRAERSK